MRALDKAILVLSFLISSNSITLGAETKSPTLTPALEKKAKSHYVLCASCHGLQGEGKKQLQAPTIAGLPEWYVSRQLHNFKNRVRAYSPKDQPGLRMGPMAKTLKDVDIEIISKYVAQMPKQPMVFSITGDPYKGQKLYNVCVACHGADGKGNKILNAPPLVGLNDWYIETQLKNFKYGLRAADPIKDPIGYAMVAMANTLVDDQAIRDVIDYILALQGAKGNEAKK